METSFGSVFVERYIQFRAGPVLNYSYFIHTFYRQIPTFFLGGRTGLMVRASDSGSGDPGSILGRVGVFVSLSKRHLLPKSTGNTQE